MDEAKTSAPAAHWRRRSSQPPFPAEQAARQAAVTREALEALGKDAAIVFLNSDDPELGGRPLALATQSAAGALRVRERLDALSARAASGASPDGKAGDLNELLGAHQEEIMRLNASTSGADRTDHFRMIARYAEEIRALRDVRPVMASAPDPSAPPTIIYGSYAGDEAQATTADTSREPGAPRATT